MFKRLKENKVFHFLYSTIKVFVSIAIFLYLLFLVFQRVSNNSSLFGYRVFQIASSSMIPVYEVGDVILVKETDPSSLAVGDDITYLGEKNEMSDRIVTHRIIGFEEDPVSHEEKIRTQGIANSEQDPLVSKDRVYGKVDHKLVMMTWLNKLIRNPFGFFFLVFVPFVVVIFLEVADTIMEFRADRKEKRKSW